MQHCVRPHILFPHLLQLYGGRFVSQISQKSSLYTSPYLLTYDEMTDSDSEY